MVFLPYPPGVTPAIFSRKATRFTAEVIVGDKIVEAHIPSSGRMVELLLDGADCLLSPVGISPTRRTSYTLVAVKTNCTWVSVDSHLPNRLLALALAQRALPELNEYQLVRPEYKIGHSRFDFLLKRDECPALVEVKSVTYVRDGVAMFPDAPTARGRRHLEQLMELNSSGYSSIVIFIVQREDAEWFTSYSAIDPEFAKTLQQVQAAGVKVLAYNCQVSPQGVRLYEAIQVRI